MLPRNFRASRRNQFRQRLACKKGSREIDNVRVAEKIVEERLDGSLRVRASQLEQDDGDFLSVGHWLPVHQVIRCHKRTERATAPANLNWRVQIEICGQTGGDSGVPAVRRRPRDALRQGTSHRRRENTAPHDWHRRFSAVRDDNERQRQEKAVAPVYFKRPSESDRALGAEPGSDLLHLRGLLILNPRINAFASC